MCIHTHKPQLEGGKYGVDLCGPYPSTSALQSPVELRRTLGINAL